MNLRYTLLAVLMIVSLTSCKGVLLGIYGIKKPKHQTDEQIIRYAKHHKLKKQNIYKLNADYEQFVYDNFSNYTDTSLQYKIKTKQFLQPMQYMLFDNKGNLIVHSVNCDAGGFPNLKWNRDDAYAKFPPMPLSEVDSTFQLQQLSKHIDVIKTIGATDNADYTCVIFWNKFIGRQSRRLIRYALNNIEAERKKGTSITVLLVNNDNIYSE